MSDDIVDQAEAFDAGVTTSRNDAAHRYELHVGTDLAVIIVFRELPGHIDLIHTETQEGFEGRGLARVLVRYALDDVVASGKRIIPHCPYVAKIVARNPDLYRQYTDVPEDEF
ncbi:putative GNAT family acetyltransferase [Arthrobacter silviterrae]|uniref:N-acetyltransferase n=1 Tax=Arthrobacter silviterrae TaxID=2026658 RepID=A0ABX0D9E2_9MICC|nr:GNAT family N-acetyltransferase [Arthrobacter silviterrae]MDQ0278415.1 putative GNAT family acetyltransferase [Arthrobacter silviterrae]NGN82326.1 N-acetyltransferase [Arthrobacter silviterrae]